jgi:putative tryptophan/tyrosine transport system substrate-binding protein
MIVTIGRRELIAALGGAAVWPLAAALVGGADTLLSPKRASAQTTSSNPRIAILQTAGQASPEGHEFAEAFEEGMRTAGWIKDVNVQLDYWWADNVPQRATAAAAEIAASKPAVIVCVGSPVVGPLHRATSTIPIVFALISDPVGQGLVPSLAHPEGNITGFSNFEPEMGGKWLQLLKEMVPHTTRVAVMFNPPISPYNERFERSIEDAASSLNVKVTRAPVQVDGEIEAVFDQLAGASNAAVLVPSDAFTFARSAMIVALAAKTRLPAIYAYRRFVRDGGLISYGPDPVHQVRSTASYVDRILKGTKPGDLPVQAPTKYELVINLKTAKALGLTIPPTVLALANEVIE